MQTVEFIIDGDGNIFKETRDRQPVNAAGAITARFAKGVIRKLPSIVEIPGFGTAGVASQDDKSQYWSLRLETLVLNSEFKIKDGVLSPQFRSEPGNPLLEIDWKPPEDMRLMFVAQIVNSSETAIVNKQYLFALSGDGNAWRLPVSNLYETCELCAGNYESITTTSAQSLQRALEQFHKSGWNKDLWDRTQDLKNTSRMFRFIPKTDKGFTQQPYEGAAEGKHWSLLCQKVATEITKLIVL